MLLLKQACQGGTSPDSQAPTGLEPASTVVSLAPEVEAAMGTAWVAGTGLVGTSVTGPFSAPDFVSHPKIVLVLGKISLDVPGSSWSAGEDSLSAGCCFARSLRKLAGRELPCAKRSHEQHKQAEGDRTIAW